MRTYPPGVKGTFHKGFTVCASGIKHTSFILISELFVRLSFGVKLEPSHVFVCF